jgi:WD40 repeat protein
VEALAFSPDNKLLASGSNDTTINVWDLNTGGLVITLRGHIGGIWALAFSPDGRKLASGSNDRTIRLWGVSNWKPERTLTGHADSIKSIVFSPDGRTLASASHDKSVKIWRTSSGVERRTFKGHSSKVLDVAFSLDGRFLTSADANGQLKLWDVTKGKELKLASEPDKQEEYIETLALSGDARQAAWSVGDATIHVRETAAGGASRTLASHSAPVDSVAFSPDGRWFAMGGKGRTVSLWDIAAGRRLPHMNYQLVER